MIRRTAGRRASFNSRTRNDSSSPGEASRREATGKRFRWNYHHGLVPSLRCQSMLDFSSMAPQNRSDLVAGQGINNSTGHIAIVVIYESVQA